jgi:hypothetical protein
VISGVVVSDSEILEQAVPDGRLPGLAEFLAWVPDRRRPRGRRHRLVTILLLTCAAVAAGSKSLAAIAEWAARAPQWVLEAAGARRDPRAGPPAEIIVMTDDGPGPPGIPLEGARVLTASSAAEHARHREVIARLDRIGPDAGHPLQRAGSHG